MKNLNQNLLFYILSRLSRIGGQTKLKENVVDLIELGSNEQLQKYLKEGQEEQGTFKQNHVIVV